MMKKRTRIAGFLMAALVLGSLSWTAKGEEPIRLACVGDSITAGVGASSGFQAYPYQLQRMLGPGWDVQNFGNSGSTLLNAGDKPYQKQDSFQKALAFKPNVVVIMLGTNDSKPQNWKLKDQFVADYKDLLSKFQALETHPKIFLCTPPFVPGIGNFGINEPVLKDEQIPMLVNLAKEENLPLLDNHKATSGKDALFPDRVHPKNEGASLLAKTVYEGVTGKAYEGEIPTSYDKEWQGLKLREFEVASRRCFLVVPEKPLPGNPWIWRIEFFGAYPSVDIALAKAGYYVAYMDVSGMWGSPKAMDLMDQFYDFAVKDLQLNPKTIPEGFSRGGLFALNWGTRHPDRIASMYLDAPLCNFKSFADAGLNTQFGAEILKAYGWTGEQLLESKDNPVDNLKAMADAHVPIVVVYGDADKTVIPSINVLLLESKYKELGGEILLISKPGGDHHPHSLDDPKPVVDFITAHQK